MSLRRFLRFSLSLTCGLAAGGGALQAVGQAVNTIKFTPPPNLTPNAVVLPTAGGWLVKSVVFNRDSSLMSLLRLSPALTATRERHYRLANTLRGSYGNFLPTTHGLIGGMATTGSTTALVCLDSTFAERWNVRFLPNIFAGLLAMNGPDLLTCYGPKHGTAFFDRSLTQVWGRAATGTNWRGRGWTSTVTGWQVGQVYAPDPTGVQYLTSSGAQPALIKLDTARVHWSYLLNPGGTYAFVGKVRPAINGGFWLPMAVVPAANQATEGVVCRFDTAGNLLLTRKLSYLNRYVGITDVHALPTGEVLLAAYLRVGGGGRIQPMVVKLSASGALVWAHRWNNGATGPVGGEPTLVPLLGGGFRLFGADLTFLDLDANFNGCNFVDETANIIFATSANVTRTPLPLTPLAITFTTGSQALLTRTVPYTRTTLCTAVGLAAEAAAESALAAWPQPLPRGDALHLSLPTGWSAPATHLTLTSALGQTVWIGYWAEVINLPTRLPAGVWTLTSTGDRGRVIHRRLVTE